jgi:hypothetical protein
MLLFPTRRIRMRFFTTQGYLRGYPYGGQPQGLVVDRDHFNQR